MRDPGLSLRRRRLRAASLTPAALPLLPALLHLIYHLLKPLLLLRRHFLLKRFYALGGHSAHWTTCASTAGTTPAWSAELAHHLLGLCLLFRREDLRDLITEPLPPSAEVSVRGAASGKSAALRRQNVGNALGLFVG